MSVPIALYCRKTPYGASCAVNIAQSGLTQLRKSRCVKFCEIGCRLEATLGKGLQENISDEYKSGELKVGIDIPLPTVQIVGWRETCTKQGVLKICSTRNKTVVVTLCSTF